MGGNVETVGTLSLPQQMLTSPAGIKGATTVEGTSETETNKSVTLTEETGVSSLLSRQEQEVLLPPFLRSVLGEELSTLGENLQNLLLILDNSEGDKGGTLSGSAPFAWNGESPEWQALIESIDFTSASPSAQETKGSPVEVDGAKGTDTVAESEFQANLESLNAYIETILADSSLYQEMRLDTVTLRDIYSILVQVSMLMIYAYKNMIAELELEVEKKEAKAKKIRREGQQMKIEGWASLAATVSVSVLSIAGGYFATKTYQKDIKANNNEININNKLITEIEEGGNIDPNNNFVKRYRGEHNQADPPISAIKNENTKLEQDNTLITQRIESLRTGMHGISSSIQALSNISFIMRTEQQILRSKEERIQAEADVAKQSGAVVNQLVADLKEVIRSLVQTIEDFKAKGIYINRII